MNSPTQEHAPQRNGHSSKTMDAGTLADVKEQEKAAKTPVALSSNSSLFQPEQAIVMRQSPMWARGIAIAIMGVTVVAVTWASIATIEQVVPATGQLKPLDTVKDINAPLNGVVKEVLVENNRKVKKGEVLVIMDSSSTRAELTAAQNIRSKVLQENAFYRTLLQNGLEGSTLQRAISQLNLPWEVVALANNRAELINENKLYRQQLGLRNASGEGQLSAEQLSRLEMARFELGSRVTAAELEIRQIEKQLQQASLQLRAERSQLQEDQKILAGLLGRNEAALVEAEKSLAIEAGIVNSMTPLLEEGALARLQVEKQQQSLNDRTQQLIEQKVNTVVEVDRQKQQIESRQAEIQRLETEQSRLQSLISQAQARLANTSAVTDKDIYDRLADNNKRLAEIDSQITKIIVDNDKRLTELNGQIERAKVNLGYQEITSPVDGVVFDLKATPGYVTPPNQTEPLLKIIPADSLVAEVDVTNKDIGFVRTGMPVDVRIDSFPYSEFGGVDGEVEYVGSDALPPDQTYQFYRFPVRIKLDSQELVSHGREIPLQSGMSVTANIRVREKRTVMSIFTELFTKKIESLETVR
ncbi:HlyD family of secretion proteins [Synechocystis sp. PCC 6803]|jgi:HlyD family secretion protein|uniref:HlyD family of secretion proteins n=2 Tax=unclassified Synechocystis TaxID=2640012 RepID=P74175_SYNY3|nr:MULTISPECIES: HlyD family efflux transporter periplasmic adaptor subunit [unclassified Synechocystis]BAM55025.1 HlyD family secretion protein [Synechocystis sp. PCC 6803] [Bacillus subtilis BEST7613]AGF51952.1 HlyD family of secretion proteins [Synechocystis sp. PCC 6803]ALJ67919.1 hemolysin secretion protein D [Synechocystis sp. PCC 6803]MBD2619225.1 HlyD family efflux transporter periplasmic adaptor subunit [Synechocystis sp. FACHB-898]MBD2639611.1 HlyD family efflux transporter periplasm